MIVDASSSPVFYHLTGEAALSHLASSSHGLSQQEAESRLAHYGRNALPRSKPPSLLWVFLRQFVSHDLEVDESLLTGESMVVLKDAQKTVSLESALGDRVNMAYAGTLVSRGRGRGLVIGTALSTELGHIASAVLNKPAAKAPLQLRMEHFTQRVAMYVGLAALLMAMVSLSHGNAAG